MAKEGNESRSSLSSHGLELSSGDDSVCSSSDESVKMDDLTTASGSEDLSTQNNVAVSHGTNPPDMPANTFPFLKLPLELRMRVYYYVFCLDREWYFYDFTFWTRCLECENEELSSCMRIPGKCLDNDDSPAAGDAKESILALLRTCHQIYQEARYEIFKFNTFYFDNFDDDERFTSKLLLPVQRSAIRNISVGLKPYSSKEFGMQSPELCKWLSEFKGLRSADLYLWEYWDLEPIDQHLRSDADSWEKAISLLQDLGTLHWIGEMCSDTPSYCSTIISGQLRLCLGQQPTAKQVNGRPADQGLSGNELKFLYWNNRVSWQNLPKEWMKN